MNKKVEIKDIEGNIIFTIKKEKCTLKDAIEIGNIIGRNFFCACLFRKSLVGANLRNAKLSGAILRHADLRGANLTDANLSEADLSYADLRGADLSGAILYNSNLCYASLVNADFHNANIRDANLSNADFSGAKNVPYIPLNCPSEGSFIGWKKVRNKLIKLEIPEDARRSSATSNKCRCDKAKVLSITDIDGSNPIDSIVNDTYSNVTYKVGEMVYPDSFDKNRWNECSHGIHFFTNKQNAIDYTYC